LMRCYRLITPGLNLNESETLATAILAQSAK
jgi:hypothetical protein